MQTATFAMAGVSMVASLGTLLLLAKIAKEGLSAKARAEAEIESVKVKVEHNAKVIKTALSGLVI